MITVLAGMMATKPWSTTQQVKVMTDASALSCHDAPVTASQAVHVHLNKVAWWLDLQASQSISQLHSITASTASMPVIEASGPKPDGAADSSAVCESMPRPAASSRDEDSSKMAGLALGSTGALCILFWCKALHLKRLVLLVCCLSVACALYAIGLAIFLSSAVAHVSIWLAEWHETQHHLEFARGASCRATRDSTLQGCSAMQSL